MKKLNEVRLSRWVFILRCLIKSDLLPSYFTCSLPRWKQRAPGKGQEKVPFSLLLLKSSYVGPKAPGHPNPTTSGEPASTYCLLSTPRLQRAVLWLHPHHSEGISPACGQRYVLWSLPGDTVREWGGKSRTINSLQPSYLRVIGLFPFIHIKEFMMSQLCLMLAPQCPGFCQATEQTLVSTSSCSLLATAWVSHIHDVTLVHKPVLLSLVKSL